MLRVNQPKDYFKNQKRMVVKKFLLLSDVHATNQTPVGRKDEIIKTFKNKFTFVLNYAKKHNSAILQAGDFFDKSRDWHILHLMSQLLKKYKVPIYTVCGQHDLYMRSHPQDTPSTLGILNKIGLIKILDEKPTILNNTNIYGCSWKATIPKPDPSKTNILVIHAPITTKGLFPRHDFTATNHFMAKNKGWDLILAGDIHIKGICQGKKTILANTGPMLRLASNKYNMKHKPCFFIYDTESRKLKDITIPHQNSTMVLTRKHLDKEKLQIDAGSVTKLKKFARLIGNQTSKKPVVKDVLDSLMKANNTKEEVKNFLYEVMSNGN